MPQIRDFRANFENVPRESVSRFSRECSLFSFSFIRQSRDSLAKYFGENTCIDFLNSRPVRDT